MKSYFTRTRVQKITYATRASDLLVKPVILICLYFSDSEASELDDFHAEEDSQSESEDDNDVDNNISDYDSEEEDEEVYTDHEEISEEDDEFEGNETELDE